MTSNPGTPRAIALALVLSCLLASPSAAQNLVQVLAQDPNCVEAVSPRYSRAARSAYASVWLATAAARHKLASERFKHG